MLYSFLWVIPRHLNFMCQHFGTLCLFHLHRPMKMEQAERSETSAHKIQMPGNYPEESIQRFIKLVMQCAKYRYKIYKICFKFLKLI